MSSSLKTLRSPTRPNYRCFGWKGSDGRRSIVPIGLGLSLLLASSGVLAAAPPKHAVHVEVRALEAPRTAMVSVTFTEAPTYTARLDKGNRRLLVDVTNADVVGAQPALTDRVGVVGGVMTQAFQTPEGKMTRVLVTLVEDAKYSVSVEGKDPSFGFVPGHRESTAWRSIPTPRRRPPKSRRRASPPCTSSTTRTKTT